MVAATIIGVGAAVLSYRLHAQRQLTGLRLVNVPHLT
jgi:hypothetical protein